MDHSPLKIRFLNMINYFEIAVKFITLQKNYAMMRSKPFLLLFFILCTLFANAQVKYFKMPENVADSDFIAKTIIINIKPEYRTLCNENIIDIPKLISAFNFIGTSSVVKKFPGKKPPSTAYNRYGDKMIDLSLIYELKYTGNLKIESAINKLLSTGLLEYAEPHYLPHLLDAYNPDDTYADTTNADFREWHLKKIKAYEAWGIQKGDTNIVIGITDTGTEIFHPDLINSIKINYADPINGEDDDGDGFVDNYYGWDLGDNDNNPGWNNGDSHLRHGIHVAGLASATVNNGIGVAGTGFKCKYLPVKIADTAGALTMAYEGIVYAADHGCSIINCSWGGFGGAGLFGQSIVDYATNNMGALVVAAAGNFNNNFPVYPASYNNVLSVANTDQNDHRWVDITDGTGSTYGINVDIAAPGRSVWSTWTNGGYTQSTGTSMAAPIVCGAAAIVKKHFPTYSATQIAAQLMASADNIDTIPYNIPYAGLMGSGRLNMYRALTNNSPWIKMIRDSINDGNDQSYVPGDILQISGVYKNYLQTSNSDLKVTLSSTSPYIHITSDSISLLGTIAQLATKNNYSDPFYAQILPGTPYSTQIDFKLTFEDAQLNYKSTQFFNLMVNIDYMTIDTNQIATTITSKGKIGYNEPNNISQGIGYTYKNSWSYLVGHCAGFLVGNSTSQVSDNLYGSAAGTSDNDFRSLTVVHKIIPAVIGDLETECKFNDDYAGTNKLNLAITHKTYVWSAAPKDKFIIMEYTIKNNSLTNTLSSLYAGLFMDWDMTANGEPNDRVGFDATYRMGYTTSSDGGPYSAIMLLSNGIVRHYAFDKDGAFNGSNNSININDGFTSYEKYSALKTNINRNLAGTSQNGNDVADMISTGPFQLLPGDSVIATFALISGDHLADIQASASEADNFYNHTGISEMELNNSISISEIYPNPSNGSISLSIHLTKQSNVVLNLTDLNGKVVQCLKSENLSHGDHPFTFETTDIAQGTYHISLVCGTTIVSKDVTIIK